MVFTTDVATTSPLPPTARRAPLRLFLLGRSAVVMLTSVIGIALFCLWVTLVAVSPLTVVAPLVVPVTALVRRYADVHRRGVQRLSGASVPRPYRPATRRGVIGRVWEIERDPASWPDALWLLLHAVVAFVTSTLSFVLFAGGLFYLIYPFLDWVTPENVFNRPIGDEVVLHSVAQSTAVNPLALVSFGLWYLLAVPLARAEVSLTRSLLRPA
jgi:uncharacterized membrane protein YhaH (DUF805 family)